MRYWGIAAPSARTDPVPASAYATNDGPPIRQSGGISEHPPVMVESLVQHSNHRLHSTAMDQALAGNFTPVLAWHLNSVQTDSRERPGRSLQYEGLRSVCWT
jgi:hypothetical protein